MVVGYDSLQRTADLGRVIDASNRHNRGKINVVYGPFTLTANAATSTLTDPRISPQSWIGFCAQTANAATEIATLRVTAQVNGSATITHANNAQTDRTFNVLIIG